MLSRDRAEVRIYFCYWDSLRLCFSMKGSGVRSSSWGLGRVIVEEGEVY